MEIINNNNLKDNGMLSVREKVCSFENLYKSIWICSKNVKWKDSVMRQSNHALASALRLKESLDNDTYEISPYSEFVIHEPKTRLITSTRFKDRVFQRSLCDNYVYEAMTKDFIPTNFACQIGKGTDRARECLKDYLRSYYKEYGTDGYYLKIDLHNYFGSTRHDVAKEAISKRIDDEWAKRKLFDIVDSFNKDTEVGIGLGSQVSQLIELAVLDDLDHYITEILGIKYYLRYMDDLILLYPNKVSLEACLKIIRIRLNKIGLELNEKKTMIQPIRHPIKFLGFSFLLKRTGRVSVKLLPKNIKAEKRKLRKLVKLIGKGVLSEKQVDDCFKSWLAHAKKTDSRGARLRMNAYYHRLLSEGGFKNVE